MKVHLDFFLSSLSFCLFKLLVVTERLRFIFAKQSTFARVGVQGEVEFVCAGFSLPSSCSPGCGRGSTWVRPGLQHLSEPRGPPSPQRGYGSWEDPRSRF